MKHKLEILFEDNHLLVINKPAMIPTMGTGDDEPGLVGLARDYIGEKYQKPGKVFLGIVSRLDAWVSGAIVFARTSKAASRLSEQFRTRAIEKTYLALIDQNSENQTELPETGTLEHLVGKDERKKRMQAISPENKSHQLSEPKLARLEYRTLTQKGAQRLIAVNLITGRKHQIRVQFSAIGWPVVGDRKYDSSSSFPVGIALHSHLLSLEHPTIRDRMDFRAKLPNYWPEFAKNFG